MTDFDFKILDDYLRNNLSTRQLCKKYTSLNDPTGFRSHYILKKYSLTPKYKGSLFILNKRESRRIVLSLMETKNPLKVDWGYIKPSIISKYGDTTIICKDSESAYYTLDGEMRNNVMKFFRSKKKEVGICQFKNCKKTDLDCAHKRNYERKNIFRNILKRMQLYKNGKYRIEVQEFMKEFIYFHKKSIIYFLCKKHHTEYDKSKNPRAFEKMINSNL